MKELFKRVLLLSHTGIRILTVLFLVLLIGALLSGSFDGDLIPVF